jgi:predicted nucleotidyltransferase
MIGLIGRPPEALPVAYRRDVQRAVEILAGAGCTQVYLFGSLAVGRAGHHADIDLAVEGCPKGQFFQVLGRLLLELEHPVDLIDLDSRDDGFAQNLKTQGARLMTGRVPSSEIEFEIKQIDQLLATYADLLRQAQEGPPGLVEKTALASVLHSFYNGLENIFLAVAKGIDRHTLTGSEWHRDLLKQMAAPTSARPALFREETIAALVAHLSFRHFYRHTYSFVLEWDKMEHLILPLPELWPQARGELVEFLQALPP